MDSVNRSRCRTAASRSVLLAAVALLALLAAPPALGQVEIEEVHGKRLPDLDTRTARVAPTDDQRAAVRALGASIRWNEFGTPQSLIKYGGYLETGVAGDSAGAAARAWVGANRALFRLSSTDGLELVRSVELKGSDGHAVVFRQTFDGFDG